jgi:hypothetical protein
VADDGFHPNLQQSDRVARNRLHHVKSSEIDADTAQSEGMQRFAAISRRRARYAESPVGRDNR